jgi:hypothetical protein
VRLEAALGLVGTQFKRLVALFALQAIEQSTLARVGWTQNGNDKGNVAVVAIFVIIVIFGRKTASEKGVDRVWATRFPMDATIVDSQ